MLPKGVETPRLKALKAIFDAASASDIAAWPQPKEKDFVLIGGLVVLYSYIDLGLRRIAEAADVAGVLAARWKGKTARLRISDVETAVLSLPDWSSSNEYALTQIKEHRGLRNLVAHFAIRRFPDDDAFLFITKSASDYKREFGVDPAPGIAMTAIVECQKAKDALAHIEKLHTWLAAATPDLERMFDAKSNPA